MRKRIFSFLLAVALVCTMLPQIQMEVNATDSKYVVGNGVTIPNSNVPADGTNKYCQCNIAIGTKGHWCCWYYGYYAYYHIWGSYPDRSNNSSHYLRNLSASDRTLTADHLRKYLIDAKPGALLRIDKSSTPSAGDDDGHTLIFVKMNSSGNGAYFLEGNHDNRGRTRIHEWTFSNLIAQYGPGSSSDYQYIKYIMWPKAPAYESGPIISFDPNGGECDTSSKSVVVDQKIGTLPVAYHDELNFEGWYTEPYGGKEVTEDSYASGNMTLYAHYSYSDEKINFDLNGGTVPGAVLTETIDEINNGRPSESLVIFSESGTQPGTNTYGKEIAVNNQGKITAIREYGDSTQLKVPNGGFILSGQQGYDSSAGVSTGGAMFVKQIIAMDEAYVSFNYETGEVKVFDSYAGYLYETKRGREYTTLGVLPVPTRDGYIFDGWQGDGGKTVDYYSGFAGINLTASWVREESVSPEATMEFGGHYYELYDNNVSWTEAKRICEEKGGYLVAITSASEQTAVVELTQEGVRGMYRIGATDANSEGTWKWVNGEKFSYSNWDPGYPEPSDGDGEDYANIIAIENPPNKQVGEWVDDVNVFYGNFYDLSNTGFICEYDQKICSHSYSVTVVSATCITPGYRQYICNWCGNSYREEIPATGNHNYRNGCCVSCGRDDPNGSVILCYDGNGGTTFDDVTVTRGETVTINSEYPEKFGCYFTGYEYNGAKYHPGDEITVGEDITLRATWSEWWQYYDSNDGDLWGVNDTIVSPGQGSYFWFNVDTSGQYRLEGASSFDTVVEVYDANGNLLKSDDDGGTDHQFMLDYYFSADEDYVVYVRPYSASATGRLSWNIKKGYRIYYSYANDGGLVIGDYCYANSIATSAEWTAKITSFVPERVGYTFMGWSLYDDAATASYQPGKTAVLEYGMSLISDGALPTDAGYAILYAVWKQVDTAWSGYIFDVSISQSGEESWFEFVPEKTTSYQFADLPIYDVQPDSRIWIYDSQGTLIGSDDDSGEGHMFDLKCDLTAGQTYYIRAGLYSGTGTYTFGIGTGKLVTYNANGGTGAPASTYVYGVTSDRLSSTVPTRSGYEFLGWATSANATSASYQPGWNFNTSVDVTLYAVWERRALTGTCGDDLTWTLDTSGTLTISGTGAMTDYSGAANTPWFGSHPIIKVVIQQGVTSIGNNAFASTYLSEIVIPSSVTSIGDNAFGMSYLQEIDIPSSVTTIGNGAFSSCFLTEVTIPASVTSIGVAPFSYCSYLSKINVDSANKYYCSDEFGVLYNKSKTVLIEAPCKIVGSYVIPDGVTTIDVSAFAHCSGLGAIAIPNSVTSIKEAAFYDCDCLTDISLSENIASIGARTFDNCARLSDLYYYGTEAQWLLISIDSVNDGLNNITIHCLGHAHSIVTHSAKSPTCTEVGWNAYETCETCDYTTYAEIAATGHSYTSVVTAPTCTAQGYTTHTCACGDSYTDTQVAALGHSMGQWQIRRAATCTANGSRRQDCTLCSYYKTEVISATGHSYTSVVTAPTCTAQGYTTHTCRTCSDTFKDTYVTALGHTWDNGVVTTAPTEQQTGLKTYTCQTCAATKTEVIPTLEHVHRYTASVTQPTCTAQGYTTYTCTCGDSYTDTQVAALGHSMGQWQVTKAATCTEQGSRRRECSRCDHYETEEISATGHSYTSVVTAPTCTAQGYTTHTCACGDSYTDTQVAALGHSMGQWQIRRAATCTANGSRRQDCTLCSYYKTEVISATGHSYTSVVTAPTCTAQGYTTHTCRTCSDTFKDTYVTALGHTWDNGVVTTAPTEQQTGLKTYTCQTCAATKTEVIPTLEHVHRYTASVTQPTCTAQGYTTYTCTCGDSYTDTQVAALGHSMGQWQVTKAATCTEQGSRRRECSRCDHYETEVISATGHSYTSVVTAPTCTAQGYTTHTCTCGDSHTDTQVAALGHAYTNGTCSRCGDILSVTGAAVKVQPNKTQYEAGESLDTAGLVLSITYANGSTQDITQGFAVTGFDPDVVGVQTLTVTYKGCSATFTVTVNKKAVDENAPQIVISNSSGIAGNQVSVSIALKNNPGIASATLQVDFDESVLTLVEVRDLGELGVNTHNPQLSAPYTLRWANNTLTNDITFNGNVVTLVFEISETAALGEYPVTVSYDYENYDIIDTQMNNVLFYVVDGSVRVMDVMVGDVNGDGRVNNLDSMILDRYLAKWSDYMNGAVILEAADVNCDGRVNNLDSMILSRHLAKWSGYTTLPYEP